MCFDASFDAAGKHGYHSGIHRNYPVEQTISEIMF